MIERMKEVLPPQLIDAARDNSSGELAWQYPAILQVVTTLSAQGYVILGGDVMHDDGAGTLDYHHDGIYCGNWHLDRAEDWYWAEYVAESAAETVGYIEAYVQRNSIDYWFVPVIADEEWYRSLELHAHKP